MQLVDAGSVDRDLILFGQAEVAGYHFRIVRRQLAVYKLASERHLHPFETELGGQRQRVRVGAQVQIPVRHTNAQLLFFGKGYLRTEAGRYS